MKGSQSRILTTHVGSLPRPDTLIEAFGRRYAGEADEDALAELLTKSVAEVVRHQVECGVDIVNDGEYGKSTTAASDYGPWLAYAWERLGGWERKEGAGGALQLRDADQFPTFYPEMWQEVGGAAGSAAEFIFHTVFTGPVTYVGQDLTRRDLDNLKAALAGVSVEEAFVTAVAPASISRGNNRYYDTERDYLFALADALHEEYQAIVDAGFVLQLDDPSLGDEYALSPPEMTLEEYKAAQVVKIEAANRALEGIPRDRVRYHVCWGSWHGPHTTDVPLQVILDLLLEVNAGALSVEAGNVRHELDYQAWEGVEVPDRLIVIPGVVSHATNLVEPPELVAERITRYAEIVGRERVIAGTDCGLGGRIHPEIAWAKLKGLSEGAKLASERLWASERVSA
jgi:5-methyltetrahydropteroyltriglutamate--homocysteine methyltransferase